MGCKVSATKYIPDRQLPSHVQIHYPLITSPIVVEPLHVKTISSSSSSSSSHQHNHTPTPPPLQLTPLLRDHHVDAPIPYTATSTLDPGQNPLSIYYHDPQSPFYGNTPHSPATPPVTRLIQSARNTPSASSSANKRKSQPLTARVAAKDDQREKGDKSKTPPLSSSRHVLIHSTRSFYPSKRSIVSNWVL